MASVLKVESFLAEGRLRADLDARPDDPVILRELAGICLAKHQPDEALALAERLCAVAPSDDGARALHAKCLRRGVAAADPRSFEAQRELGMAAQEMGDHPRAIDALYACVQMNPRDPDVMVRLAKSLNACRRFDDAVHVYATLMVNTWPGLGDYLASIAENLRSVQRSEDALAVMRFAALLLPDSGPIADYLARALAQAGRWDEALRECERAVSLGTANYELNVVRCTVHHLAGRMDEALAEIDHALSLAPEDEMAIMNRALILMAQGRWDEGWPGYDRRLGGCFLKDAERQWTGEAMDGTLLVVGEQGLGDQIQSLRYLPLIRPRVKGRLVVQLAESLIRLASESLAGVDEWVPLSAPSPAYDRYIPMMSLIKALDRGLPGTRPVPVPFLRPPAETSVALPDAPGFKVGLCWAGSPGFPADYIRSMPASEVARLVRRFPQVTFYRLQRGPVSSHVGEPAAGLPLLDAVRDCADYADTAAVIHRLDLVISVDTSLAHVAAALGKETWILIPHVACFRWGQTGEKTPLYPSATLIRQPRRGEGWGEAMDEVTRRLSTRV